MVSWFPNYKALFQNFPSTKGHGLLPKLPDSTKKYPIKNNISLIFWMAFTKSANSI